MLLSSLVKILSFLTVVHAVPYPQLQQQQQKQKVVQQPQQQQNPASTLAQSKQDESEQSADADQSPAAASAPSISYLDKDGTTNVLENPAYNPDIYSTFIPQDAIQQYLNYFGGPVPYTAGILPPPTPMAVQTGYEGYIIPVRQEQQQDNDSAPAVWSLLRSLVPKVIFAWVAKLAVMAMSAVGLVLFGGALTTAICALTPLCSISFTAALPTIGKSMGNAATFERVKRAAEFLQGAIEKYNALQESEKKVVVKKFGRNQ